MIGGGTTVSEPIVKHAKMPAPSLNGVADAAAEEALAHIRESLRGLKFGSVNIIVQDGVIIQIDRTEKHRLRANRNNS